MSPNVGFSKHLMREAHLVGAPFSNIDWTNAVFDGSNLENADFSGSILSGVSFKNCNIQGVNFDRAQGLETALFTGANLDEYTKWPEGINGALLVRLNGTLAEFENPVLGGDVPTSPKRESLVSLLEVMEHQAEQALKGN